MYPWFEAPAAGSPLKYEGWVWDPTIVDWVAVAVEKIEVHVAPKREPKPEVEPSEPLADRLPGWFWVYSQQEWRKDAHFRSGHYALEPYPPMPTVPPGRVQPQEVDGWKYNWDTFHWEKTTYEQRTIWITDPWPPMPDRAPDIGFPDVAGNWSWDYSSKEWVPITIYAESVEIEPPRTLPPGVDEAALFEMYSWEQLYLEEVQAFVAQGFTLEAAKRITRENFDPLLRMIRAKSHAATKNEWNEMAVTLAAREAYLIETIGLYAVLGIIAAVVGVMVGYILQKHILPDPERVFETCKVLTYLLGPEDWIYSRNIGKSVEGSDYFSVCDGIGTDLTRHKRSTWGYEIDNIDFPGGFIESGYQFPYWIKYTWEFWELEYVGFLRSAGPGFYVLKPEAKHSGPFWPGYMSRQEDWCIDFRYYL